MNVYSILKQPLVVVTWIFILLFVILRFGPTFPFSVTTQERGDPFVVSESGSATGVPDQAVMSFGINEQASTVLDAQNKANQKSQTLVSALKNVGVQERDIKTTSYNVRPDYDYRSEPARITGYSVNIRYSVKVRELDKANDAINAGTQAGANSIGGVSLTLSDEKRDELLAEARKEAIQKAKSKAENLASLAGLNLGKLINVSEGSGIIPTPYRAQTFDSSGLEAAPVAEAEITPGESEVSTTVSLSWEIR